MQISFVLLEDELEQLKRLDPDRDWRSFVTTTRAWILQTYLRLRQAGMEASLRSSLPETGIALISAGDYRTLRAQVSEPTRAIIVSVRGSHHRTPAFADFEIVQNPLQAGARRFFMTHWPQPGLLPRDQTRGTQIERMSYKGFAENLAAEFLDGRWQSFLSSHGIEWCNDSVPYNDLQTQTATLKWDDYRKVDLVLAVRVQDAALYPGRPATKLYNAWLAQVPALLGPESAFRAARTNDDDYIEVTSLEDAQRAVLNLLGDREKYQRLLARCCERAADVSVESTIARWHALLFKTLPDEARRRQLERRRPQTLSWRQLAGRVRWLW